MNAIHTACWHSLDDIAVRLNKRLANRTKLVMFILILRGFCCFSILNKQLLLKEEAFSRLLKCIIKELLTSIYVLSLLILFLVKILLNLKTQ